MDKKANRLHELRKRRKTSQLAVGLGVNLSQSRVSEYENADVIPSDILMGTSKNPINMLRMELQARKKRYLFQSGVNIA